MLIISVLVINAENAAHKSDKFTHMARRTRYEYLKDLAMNQVSQQALETSNKFGKLSQILYFLPCLRFAACGWR